MAASVIGALRVTLGLDSASFERNASRAQKTSARLRKAVAAIAAGAAAAAAGLVALARRAAVTIDSQAKLAQSLGTTTKSIQVLQRAGDLAGVSLGEIQQATLQLTRRLSQAANGAGPAADALERLGLSATELQALPLDERIIKIQEALEATIPASQRAAVASQLFGDRAGLIFSRIDTATLAQATAEVDKFGVAVSDVEADAIERANDAISSLGLIATGVGNRIAVALAPALEAAANALGDFFSRAGPGGQILVGLSTAITTLVDNLGRIASILGVVAGLLAAKFVVAIGAAVIGVGGLSTALLVLRGALIRTGIGALIVLAGELVFQFSRLVEAAGGFGEAFELVKNVAVAVFQDMGEAAQSFVLRMQAVAAEIRAAFTVAFSDVARVYSEFLGKLAANVPDLPGFGALGEKLAASASEAGARFIELAATADGVAQSANRLRGEAEALASQGFDKTAAAVQRLRDALDSAIQERDSEEATRLAAELAALAAAGEDAGDGVATGAAKGSAGLRKLTEDAEEARTGLEDLEITGKEISEGLSQAFSDIVRGTDSLRGAIGKLASSFADQFLQLGFRQLLNAAFPGLGAFSIGGNAVGTSNFEGGVSLVGERGPELVSLPRGSKVFDSNRTQSMLARGSDAPPVVNVTPKIANILDPSLVGDFLGTPEGEQLIVNVMQRNREGM